jgi:two-component system, OmpR family, response regulator VicR
MKLLIIEDDADIVNAISLAFRYYWPDVELFSTHLGTQGIELTRNEKPDVILLDLGLPDITGFEVLQQIRRFSSVPVLILTVRSSEEDVLKAIEEKANAYIVKPFRQMELMKRLESILKIERLIT